MKILIYDNTEKKLIGLSWKIGAFLFRPLFDKIIPANSWDQAITDLKAFVGKKKASEVQFWGHGVPGAPLIDNKPMSLRDDRIFSTTHRWWFRCCSLLSTVRGKKFAGWFVERGVEIVSHTSVIGMMGLHPFLFGLKPGQDPYWDDEEKGWREPNNRTITALRMNLPCWAFDEDRS